MPTFNNLFSVSFISHSLPDGPVADCHIMWPTHAIQGVMRNHYCRKLFALYYDMQYGYFHPIKFIALGSTKIQVEFIYYSISLFFTFFLSSTMSLAPGSSRTLPWFGDEETHHRTLPSGDDARRLVTLHLGKGSLCELDEPRVVVMRTV